MSRHDLGGTNSDVEDEAMENGLGSPKFASSSSGSHENMVRANHDPMRSFRRIALRTFIIVAVFSVFVNVLMLTMPIYLFQLSDRVLTSRSFDTLTMLTMLAVGLIGVLSVLDILRRQILGRLAVSFETILAAPVLTSIVNSAPTGSGGSTTPLRGLQQVRSFLVSPTMLYLFDAPLAPLYFAAIFLIHMSLGTVVVVAAAILIVTAIVNQKATWRPLAEAGNYSARADAHAESFARNAQVIGALGMMEESISHWGREQALALKHQIGGQDRNFWIGGVSKFIRLITQIGVLGYGAYLALNGEVTGGMMIAAAVIASRALQPLEGMIEGWRSLVSTRRAYERVKEAVEAVRKERPRLTLPRPAGQMIVSKVLYIPPGTKEPALNGISFCLKAGECLAIVGPSGSGKSTLARLLVGCLVPTSGKVRLDGTELRNWDRRQFGVSIGFLPQEVELFPGTIRDNVCRMRNELPDIEVYRASKAAGVHEMITQLPHGYETVLDRNGAPLSGGQKQRIALARAFFGKPSLVVLDEPNAHLDSIGEQALAETIRRAKADKVTLVVITQRPALLNIVDKVLILQGGRLEAFGAPSEVLRRIVKPSAKPGIPRASERLQPAAG